MLNYNSHTTIGWFLYPLSNERIAPCIFEKYLGDHKYIFFIRGDHKYLDTQIIMYII